MDQRSGGTSDGASFESLSIDLENYFSNTIIPQLFVDKDFILRKFTPPAMKQFNLSNADIGKTCHELSNNFRFSGIVDNILEVIQSHIILEKEIQTLDMRWYQMNILPYIVRETGLFNGVIITFVDITARILDLKELEKLIGEHQLLIDSISHDIKNPLAGLLLALDIVKPNVRPSAETTIAIEIIERSATRIKVMTEDLLQMRRESTIQSAEAELLDIQNILEDVRLALTKQIQDAKAQINTNFSVTEIHFSRRKLRSIIYNLVSNAIKYRSPERPCEIKLNSYRENGQVVFQVGDNGIGIARDKFQLVFTKYYRVQDNLEGTGIGLYLVHEMVQSAGGSVNIESEQGKGSIFTVRLNT